MIGFQRKALLEASSYFIFDANMLSNFTVGGVLIFILHMTIHKPRKRRNKANSDRPHRQSQNPYKSGEFYFKCTKCSAELTIKTNPQNSHYVVESAASRNFEHWLAEDEEADKEKQKRETEEIGDAMKSLENRTLDSKRENRTLDSKREMDILATLDEVKSMRSRQATISVDAMMEVLQRSAEEKMTLMRGLPEIFWCMEKKFLDNSWFVCTWTVKSANEYIWRLAN
ncbi:hypothetical protein HYC85_009593 [Camellia sinensis]|uniref:Uncharacterized protein n=1 Tax=Camellia sinensis TaxID=4442 RepID=A0A7J7HG36_CAMSI|nr:hypothetical protein HYC85_009593 [Camellia sinensis]